MILYHYTRSRYLPSIQKIGLVPGHSLSPYIPVIRDTKYVWLDKKLYVQKKKGNAVLAINTDMLDQNKLEPVYYSEDWLKHRGVIHPEAISVVYAIPE